MADEDDDEVAMEGDPEPAAQPGGERPAATVAPTVVPTPKGTRGISPEVRRAFQAAMEKARATAVKEPDEEGALEPVQHDELPVESAKGDAPEAQPPEQEPERASAPSQPPAPPQPPQPQPDPEILRMRSDLEKQRADFEAEKAKWFEDRKTADLSTYREQFFDRGAPAIVEIVKQWMPGLEGDDLKREVADLIQDLAHQYLDAPLEDSVRDRIENKRVRAGFRAWKAEQERMAELERKRQSALQEKENQLRMRQILQQEVLKPEHAAKYPFLALEDNPGDLVAEVIEHEYRATGVRPTWMEAAQRAEDWLKQQSLAYYDKRKHLLSPQPQPPATSEKQRTQVGAQVQHAARAASKPQPPQAPPTPKKWTPESHRAQTMSKWRSQLKAQTFADDE